VLVDAAPRWGLCGRDAAPLYAGGDGGGCGRL